MDILERKKEREAGREGGREERGRKGAVVMGLRRERAVMMEVSVGCSKCLRLCLGIRIRIVMCWWWLS